MIVAEQASGVIINADSAQIYRDLPILSDDAIADEVARKGIRIGIVAVPAEAAQAVADALVRGGVTAILNYAPCLLRAPNGVAIRDIDPVGAMQSMTYYLEP